MTGNHLLVLDDDLRVLQLLAEIARRQRYETTLTSTIPQFLEAYDTVQPSLIILDLQYENGDGIDLMSKLKERGCPVPIILISGFDIRVLETARRIGEGNGLRVVGALPKPIQMRELRALLDSHREPETDEWANEIRVALEQEQLTIHYQPKVDAGHGHVVGFEALTRWLHPQRGLIGPDRFIPLAESTGLIGPLTDYVLARSVADCAGWAAAGLTASVAVNIAAPILTDAHILDELSGLLRQHQLSASRVIFEVTESTAMQNPKVAMEVLGRLRLHGVKLSLDDFGTGFSNLALLQQMPFNELKIDKGFVLGSRTNHDSQVIVRTLAGLAQNLGLSVVAEGVEDLDLWGWLRTLSVDQIQGFAVARPMSAERVLDWVRTYSPPAPSELRYGVA